MLQLYFGLRRYLDNELRYKRILLVLASVYFLALGLTGDVTTGNVVVHDSLYHYAEALGSLIFFALLFLPAVRTRLVPLTYLYIYLMNAVNLWMVFTSGFYDVFCYEFTVIYIMSNFYLRDRGPQLAFNLLMGTAILIVGVWGSKEFNSSLPKYTITFVVVATGMYMMIAYKYLQMEHLEDSEARYKLLAQNSEDIIGLHDVDGRILFLSPSVTRLLGYEVTECVNKHPIGFVHPEDMPLFAKFTIDYLLEQQRYDIVAYRLRKKDGSYMMAESVFRLIHNGTEALQVMSTTRDVSSRSSA